MCELHQKLKKMYLCNIFKVCSFWSLLKHKPKELLSWFHITNLAGPFPAPKLDKNPSPQTCDYFTAQPSHDFFSPIPLTHTEQELSAAFLKCSRITFPVIQWTSSGNWCSWKQTSFPTGCFQVAGSLCSNVDDWGRWKKNWICKQVRGWYRQNCCFLQQRQLQALVWAWAPTAWTAEIMVLRGY